MNRFGCYFAVANSLIEEIAKEQTRIEKLDLTSAPQLDIDLSWQAIHHLLCGGIDQKKSPFGYVVPIRENTSVQWDCHEVFYLTHEQITEAVPILQLLTEARLNEIYDPEAMIRERIYPLTGEEDMDRFFSYIVYYFNQIRTFYEKAAQNGHGILFYLT